MFCCNVLRQCSAASSGRNRGGGVNGRFFLSELQPTHRRPLGIISRHSKSVIVIQYQPKKYKKHKPKTKTKFKNNDSRLLWK